MNTHHTEPATHRGEALDKARVAVIMLHGRGGTTADILALSTQLPAMSVAYLAPRAAGNTWYPNRFIAPVASNEPQLTHALETIATLMNQAFTVGIPYQRIILLGFSQGACLALEYAARFPRRFGGVVGLSGALIENGDQPRAYTGTLDNTPIFLGCSDIDMHIPVERVRRSQRILQGLGAQVVARIYPGMDHIVNADEIEAVNQMILSI